MVSMFLSTLMMFMSRGAIFLFLIILAVFFLFFTDAYDWKGKWKGWKERHFWEHRTAKDIRSLKLEKLKAMKNAGLLSEEEYQKRKREIDSL